jgi:hypothetical protein
VKRSALLFAFCLISLCPPADARHTGGSNSSHSLHSSHPHYGGGHHTTSHGGHYAGEVNSNHKNGHYKNSKTGDRYGQHKP